MWKSSTGSYWPSQAEADADDAAMMGGGVTAGERDYSHGSSSNVTAVAPTAPARAPDPGDAPNPLNPGGISDNELRRRKQELERSATTTANTNVNRSTSNSGSGAIG